LEPFSATGAPRLRFVFSVVMAIRDLLLLETLRDFLGYGAINRSPPRKPHHQPLAGLTIASFKAHRAATIPFAEQFLLPCAKRRQFEAWRDAMDVYERERTSHRRQHPSICSLAGCEKPVRGRGLCRSHYYAVTG